MKTNSSIRVETQITSTTWLNSIQQGLQCNTWAQRRSYLSTVARTTCSMVHHISLRLVLFPCHLFDSSPETSLQDLTARDVKFGFYSYAFLLFYSFIWCRKPCSHAVKEYTNLNPNAYFWILIDHSPNKSFVSDEWQPCQWKWFILMHSELEMRFIHLRLHLLEKTEVSHPLLDSKYSASRNDWKDQ